MTSTGRVVPVLGQYLQQKENEASQGITNDMLSQHCVELKQHSDVLYK